MSSDLIFSIINELISTDVTLVDEGNTENKNSSYGHKFRPQNVCISPFKQHEMRVHMWCSTY